MKRHLLACLMSVSLPVCAQQADDEVTAFLKKKMVQEHIPALQVAIVQHGKIVKLAAYGTANVENDVGASALSVFSINSCTKAFTGVAIMQLVEAGKLRLDDPVSRYFDDLPSAWRSITVRQVLTHVSGLPNMIDSKEKLLGDGTEASAWAALKTLPMEFKPGDRYSYNQTGYVMLGKIITKLSGEPFTTFIEKNQFVPAGMTHTQFGDSSDVVPRSAGSYSYLVNVDGAWKPSERLAATYVTFPGYLRTATGILSTSSDIANWLIALQSGKLLKDKTSLRALWTPIILNDGTTAGTNELLNGSGLGWPLTTRAEHPAAGPIGGMRSAFFVYPKDDVSVVILTNLQGANPEYFIDEVAAYYISGMHESDGFGLPPAINKLRSELVRRGFDRTEEAIADLQAKDSTFKLKENDLNVWGYKLLEQDQPAQAVSIFRLNTVLYPDSWNTHDSLAEALQKLRDNEGAAEHYKRSLELNPKNANAVEHLRQIGVAR